LTGGFLGFWLHLFSKGGKRWKKVEKGGKRWIEIFYSNFYNKVNKNGKNGKNGK
jgi:hypothetical protein